MITGNFHLLYTKLTHKKISKPIEEMSRKASAIAADSLKDSFNSNTNIYEIRELENSLNAMSNEFQQTEELRRDLMANVKTPLTMIKAYAEMVRDLTYKKKEKRDERLNIIIDETERLNTLVGDILTPSKEYGIRMYRLFIRLSN